MITTVAWLTSQMLKLKLYRHGRTHLTSIESVTTKSKHAESYRQYDEFVKFASSFLKSNKTTNAYFNTWLADKVDTDLKYLRAANFFYFGRRLNGTYDSSAAVTVILPTA